MGCRTDDCFENVSSVPSKERSMIKQMNDQYNKINILINENFKRKNEILSIIASLLLVVRVGLLIVLLLLIISHLILLLMSIWLWLLIIVASITLSRLLDLISYIISLLLLLVVLLLISICSLIIGIELLTVFKWLLVIVSVWILVKGLPLHLLLQLLLRHLHCASFQKFLCFCWVLCYNYCLIVWNAFMSVLNEVC